MMKHLTLYGYAALVLLCACGCLASHATAPVGDPPQSSATATEIGSLPAGLPNALPADPPEGAQRSASIDGARHVFGEDYFATSHGGGVERQRDMARLTSAAAGNKQLSYALYSIPLGGATASQLLVDVYLNLAPADAASTYWVGVADYGAGHWQWHGPYGDSPLVLPLATGANPPGAGLTSPGGNLFIALVVYNGASLYCAGLTANPVLLEVGPGKPHARVEDAYAYADAAVPPIGPATILVYPQPGNAPYMSPALNVSLPELHFRGVIVDGARVKLDGATFNYTGAGSVPRAMFQFNYEADSCSVAGFEMFNATNDTFNGAGVRINQADFVIVANCEIRNCDMGIMSNSSFADQTASGQSIEFCHIHHNGSLDDPGYNHNLYLGGTSAFVTCCEIDHSVTGHNFKSRARYNLVLYCYIHDSANRELDFVDDAENTTVIGSDSVLVGNVIVKAPPLDFGGNRAVIHFGQDGGNDHNGTLWLVNNTIVTQFISPVATLSAASAGCKLYNNIVWDEGSGQNNQVLIAVSGGALMTNATAGHNWLSHGQTIDPAVNTTGGNYTAGSGENPPFVGALNPDPALRDYALASSDLNIVDQGMDQHLVGTLFEYHWPLWLSPRPDDGLPDIGAYEWQ